MGIGGLDLPLLLALQHLLSTQSVTAAARALDTTQPNMSRTLARLRLMFGDSLLVGVGRRMERTAYARELQPRVERALTAMRQLVAPVPALSPELDQRVVQVAASDHAVAVLLEPWIRRLRAEAPGISVRVQPLGSESIEPLARGDLDLAIAPRVPLEGVDQFVLKKLLDDRLVCVLRRGHPRARRKLTLREYLALEHVTVGNARPTVSSVQLALHKLEKTRKVALTVPSFLSALHAVAGSDLVAALPERLVRQTDAGVVVRPLPLPPQHLSLYLVWHPRRTTDPQHRWLREGIAASVR